MDVQELVASGMEEEEWSARGCALRKSYGDN